ncbi:MAG: MBL fold metallo-hydrolase [Marinisporobacter sp.]|jgi:phosphoribosyl 1,2-cyclic phosphodiesterase|nr:MBL fold metallo-hydrolase [Marinisporobacter sp.]
MGLTFCSLASGSSGNCQYIESAEGCLLVDAGLSGKRIQQAMESIGKNMEKVQGILITHEHNDHIKGVGILSRRFNIPIYANNNTWRAMKGKLGKIDEENIRYFDTGEEFFIQDIKIKPYAISHDAIEPVGFSLYHDDAKVSIVTDTGYIPDTVKKEIQGSDLLMLESNHDVEMLKMGRYPWYLKKRVMGDEGHLSNETAGEIIAELVKLDMPINNVLLGHLSKENNFPELAFETVKNVLSSQEIKIGLDINVDLTYRDRVSSVYNIKK